MFRAPSELPPRRNLKFRSCSSLCSCSFLGPWTGTAFAAVSRVPVAPSRPRRLWSLSRLRSRLRFRLRWRRFSSRCRLDTSRVRAALCSSCRPPVDRRSGSAGADDDDVERCSSRRYPASLFVRASISFLLDSWRFNRSFSSRRWRPSSSEALAAFGRIRSSRRVQNAAVPEFPLGFPTPEDPCCGDGIGDFCC